jgi:hypothetical protein
MIDLSRIFAENIKTAFADFGKQSGRYICGEHMQRHWRNRSPVTQGYWSNYARRLVDIATYSDAERLTAALYVACGHYSEYGGHFWPETLLSVEWDAIADFTELYYLEPPEAALSRDEWESRKSA